MAILHATMYYYIRTFRWWLNGSLSSWGKNVGTPATEDFSYDMRLSIRKEICIIITIKASL